MATRQPATYEEALERIAELDEELERALDALLLLRERAASDTGSPARLSPMIARELGAEDLLEPLSPSRV